jgi:hypothetical protein
MASKRGNKGPSSNSLRDTSDTPIDNDNDNDNDNDTGNDARPAKSNLTRWRNRVFRYVTAPNMIIAMAGVSVIVVVALSIMAKIQFTASTNELEAGETSLHHGVANVLRASKRQWTPTGGVLHVSSKRLMFRPNRVSYLRAGPYDIAFEQIQSITTEEHSWMWFAGSITVTYTQPTTDDSQEEQVVDVFHIYHVDDWRNALAKAGLVDQAHRVAHDEL